MFFVTLFCRIIFLDKISLSCLLVRILQCGENRGDLEYAEIVNHVNRIDYMEGHACQKSVRNKKNRITYTDK